MLGLWHWGIYSDRGMRVYRGHILYQNDAIELAFLLWYPAGSAIFWYILVPFSSMIHCNLNVPFVRGFPSYVSWHRRVNGLESPLLFPKSQSIPWNPNLYPLKPGCSHIHSQLMIFSWKKQFIRELVGKSAGNHFFRQVTNPWISTDFPLNFPTKPMFHDTTATRLTKVMAILISAPASVMAWPQTRSGGENWAALSRWIGYGKGGPVAAATMLKTRKINMWKVHPVIDADQ